MSTSTTLAPVPTSASPRRAAAGAALTVLAVLVLSSLAAGLNLLPLPGPRVSPAEKFPLQVAGTFTARWQSLASPFLLVVVGVSFVVLLGAVGALAAVSARRFPGNRPAQFLATWFGVMAAAVLSFLVGAAFLPLYPVLPKFIRFHWVEYLMRGAGYRALWALAVGWLVAFVAVRFSAVRADHET